MFWYTYVYKNSINGILTVTIGITKDFMTRLEELCIQVSKRFYIVSTHLIYVNVKELNLQ